MTESEDNMTTNDSKRLLTLSDVARYLGVERRAVTNYVRDRGLPVIRVSKNTVRVDPRHLEAWVAERSEGATASLD